jgi:hypothetical protein
MSILLEERAPDSGASATDRFIASDRVPARRRRVTIIEYRDDARASIACER